MKLRMAFLAASACVAVQGCCAYGPCDRVSILVGRVTTIEGAPVANAKVEVHGVQLISDRNGCFDAGGIDRTPYRLVIIAPGFKPIDVTAKSGAYQVTAVVAPQESSQEGTVQWSKSRVGQLKALPECA